ncbi:MAG: hypothetical protein QME28_09285 [Candidatus Saccharicenans sp.]|nr:hypothetical protein [Candidatus Saccharicenans sp.]
MTGETCKERNTSYFTTDRINSTRVVKDDNSSVVYAAAHDLYAGDD